MNLTPKTRREDSYARNAKTVFIWSCVIHDNCFNSNQLVHMILGENRDLSYVVCLTTVSPETSCGRRAGERHYATELFTNFALCHVSLEPHESVKPSPTPIP